MVLAESGDSAFKLNHDVPGRLGESNMFHLKWRDLYFSMGFGFHCHNEGGQHLSGQAKLVDPGPDRPGPAYPSRGRRTRVMPVARGCHGRGPLVAGALPPMNPAPAMARRWASAPSRRPSSLASRCAFVP